MKVLFLGRGVIASVYGWALERAGHEVEFLVRPGRAADYGDSIRLSLLDARRGLRGTRREETWPVTLRESLEPGHGADLIVVSVGHHRLRAAVESLAPHLGSATVLIFGNVWEEPDDAVAALPPDRVAWGFPQAGGGFDADGVLQAALLRKVLFGTLGASPTAREREVRALFATAGFTIAERADIRGWMWAHAIADAGMFTPSFRLGSMSAMIGRRAAFREAVLTTRELLPLLAARGVDLRRHRAFTAGYRAPAPLVAATIAATTAHVPLARISLAAHTDAFAEEPVRLVRDVIAEARRLGVPTPRLDRAAALIDAHSSAA
ncbi:MAG: 2-dehydropantoate 2-reductase N-terminal domain-containing protein [Protaetiibacter sp.]